MRGEAWISPAGINLGYLLVPLYGLLAINRTLKNELDLGGTMVGSNNWVISGKLSKTGVPIVSNDPHRNIEMPSLRYFIHLVAPGWNVIGGSIPRIPHA